MLAGLTERWSDWMTPNVPNGGRSATHAEISGRTAMHNGKKVQVGLEHQSRIWSTPRASDPEKAGPNMRGTKGDVPLPAQAVNWPTPRTITGGGESAERKKELGREKAGGGDLQAAVQNWPTPATRDYKGANSTDHVTINGTGRMHMGQLPNFVEHAFRSSPPDPPTPAGPTSSPERRTLNPLFVEWLMGWPIGWTGSAPVETASFHWWRDMRGELSKLVSRRPARRQLEPF